MAERELRCKNCNKYVPISEMRYESTGTYLVCSACRGKKEEATKPRIVKPLPGTPFGGPKVLKYQCPKCHYMFRRTPTHPVEKCPNCGNAKLLKFEKVTANDVLAMADDKRFDRL